ncbi:hypothetical protein TNCV_3071601 [Trichonephila clavipes]|nr:hypothetical protein TNCV_3071601 [Trichonephila clavipes]
MLVIGRGFIEVFVEHFVGGKHVTIYLEGLKQRLVSEAKADNAVSALLRVVSISAKSLPEQQTMMSSVKRPNITPEEGVFSIPAKNSEKSVGLRKEPSGTPCPSTPGSENVLLNFTLIDLRWRKPEIHTKVLPRMLKVSWSLIKNLCLHTLSNAFVRSNRAAVVW